MSFSFYRAFKDREERGEEKVDCNSSSSFPFGIFFSFFHQGHVVVIMSTGGKIMAVEWHSAFCGVVPGFM